MTEPEDLSHVLWIGGAPRSGKTMLSRLLAGKYDLKIYNLDWHQVREHRARLDSTRHPISLWWERASPDERWLQPSAEALLERSASSWTETFELVVEDLRALPHDRGIVADGPGALPWCVAPLLGSDRQAIWVVPTPGLWDEVHHRRGTLTLREVSDPARFRENLKRRDLLLAQRISRACVELGLRCVTNGRDRPLEEMFAILEKHFGPLLPERLNV